MRIPGVQKRWNKLKYMKKLKQLTPPSLAKKRGIKGDLTINELAGTGPRASGEDTSLLSGFNLKAGQRSHRGRWSTFGQSLRSPLGPPHLRIAPASKLSTREAGRIILNLLPIGEKNGRGR